MKRTYEQPKWAQFIQEALKHFGNSCRALFDLIWDMTKRLFSGGGYAGKTIWTGLEVLFTWLFSTMGNALDPVVAAKAAIVFTALVCTWALYSWVEIGIYLSGMMGVDAIVGGCLGFLAGAVLNVTQMLPFAGTLFEDYADVLAAAGKDSQARSVDWWAVTSKDMLSYSYSFLKAVQGVSLITETLGSFGYQFLRGGFTKTVKVKGVAVTQALPFWSMLGTLAWCLALVKAPEWTIRSAAALIHVAAKLPSRSY